MNRVILFDGDCNFCDGSVQFIIKRDPKGYFKFASLQSDIGQQLLREHNVDKEINSFVLIDDDRCYFQSSAALRVCRRLKGPWKAFRFFHIIPRPVRDFFYNIIANNRYEWFGKKDSCMLPPPEIRKRFLS